MRPIIKWELWQRRWSIGWWVFGIMMFNFVNLIFYPTFKNDAAELEESLANIPDSARALFSDTGDFFSPVGYLSSQIFYLLMPLLLGVLAMVLGSSLIAKEEKEGTIELLLSRPISRSKLLAAKAIAGIKVLAIVGLFAAGSLVVLAKLVELAVPADNIALATLGSALLALSFGSIAFAITSLGKARVASFGIATAYALGGYIISSLAGTVEWLKWPSKLFPFHYYQSSAILEDTYDWKNMGFIITVIVVCAIVSFIAFRKRDISN